LRISIIGFVASAPMAIVQNSATLFSAHQNESIAIATATFGNAGGRRCLVMTSPQKQDLVM